MAEKFFSQPPKSQQHFSAVPAAEIERSRFDRSHGHKTTFDAGEIVPVYVDEILPGDTFDMHSTAFARLATPLKPFMDNVYLDTHFFFVPYRLVWDNWEKFCGERSVPGEDNTDLTVPRCSIDLSQITSDRLAGHMGIPVRTNATNPVVYVSALPFRAYFLIWNEWYRDQNITQPVIYPTGDADDPGMNDKPLKKRAKRHDYFTSCLPWPQKGDPVYIPLGTTAPVVPNISTPIPTIRGTIDGTVRNVQLGTSSTANVLKYSGANIATDQTWNFINSGLVADLTTATAVTINDLRTSFQIQKLLERDARGGTRYIELILSHFGVHSDDARLQRPEYLGGGTTMVNINPIAQTTPETNSPVGNLAAFGQVIGKAGFSKSFTEHGVIIGLVSARADNTYQQGIERMWSRRTRYDFYWPALAHLGEQAVLQKEIFITGVPGSGGDDKVFGYQERYAEYRYKPSRVSGKFYSEDLASLDVWHLAQDFATAPTLNDNFLAENPPIDRVIAVPAEPHFLLDMWFSLQCTRPMPVYSVPGLIDHF